MPVQAGQTTRLTDIETLGVALVKRGANRRKFGVKKGDEDDMTVAQLIAQVIQKGEMPIDEDAVNKMCEQAGLDAQGCETFKALIKLGSAYKDVPAFMKLLSEELPKLLGASGGEGTDPADPKNADPKNPAPPGTADKPPTSDAPPPKPGEHNYSGSAGDDPSRKDKPFMTQKSAEEIQKEAEAKAKADADKAAAEALAKSQADKNVALEALLKSQADSLKSMQDQLTTERDARVLESWVRKSADELKFVPGKSSAELGQMFFDLEKKISKEMAQTQFDVFKASSVALGKSALFTPAGAQSNSIAKGEGKDALSLIKKSAENILEKSDILKSDAPGLQGVQGSVQAEIHKAMAVQKALELNPELYTEYARENPSQFGDRFSNGR